MFLRNAHSSYSSFLSQQQYYLRWANVQMQSITGPRCIVQCDVAGTVIDPYCLAPFEAFKKIFAIRGIELTNKQLTDPMGMKKKDHIRCLLTETREQWKNQFGQYPTYHHVEELHQEFLTLLNKTINNYQQLTPGTDHMLEFIQENNIPFALTSGYPRSQALKATILLRLSHPTIPLTTSDDIEGGRYEMLRQNCKKLEIAHSRTLFFTDACSDIKNVLAANDPSIIVVGVSDSSTHVGITNKRELLTLSKAQLISKQQKAADLLKQSGAHAVVRNMYEAILIYVAACKWIPGTPLEIEYPENKIDNNALMKI